MYNIEDDDGNIIETNLTEREAEDLLCRYLNEDMDVYIVSQ